MAVLTGGGYSLGGANQPNTPEEQAKVDAINAQTRLSNYGDPSTYSYSPNGSGGLNYYHTINGLKIPVTNSIFGQATGQDYTALEKQAAAGSGTKNSTDDSANTNGTSTGTGTGTTLTPAERAYWEGQGQVIDDQVTRLPGQQEAGKQSILDSALAAFNTLTNQKGKANRDYNVAHDQTQQDYRTARAGIDQNVVSTNTGLQRLLGAHGAGSSSAASVLAPYAAATSGNQQRQAIATPYERNISGLDTGIADANQQFDEGFGSLETDKKNRLTTLESTGLNTKASLLAKRAEIAAKLGSGIDPTFATQVSDLGRQVDSLGAPQTFVPKTVNYQTPDLAKYQYGPAAAPVDNGGVAPGTAENTGAFWTLLGGDPTKKKLNNPALATA